MTILFGQKENAYLSLQMVSNDLTLLRNAKNQSNYSKYQTKAKNLIKEIQKTETLNKDLLVELMNNTKKQSKNLKNYSNSCKTYLSSANIEKNRSLNVVS